MEYAMKHLVAYVLLDTRAFIPRVPASQRLTDHSSESLSTIQDEADDLQNQHPLDTKATR